LTGTATGPTISGPENAPAALIRPGAGHGGISSMSTSKATPGPHKRIKTRHRGITYRLRADGSRTYYVYAGGRFQSVDGGEKEALAKQAELRSRQARGERGAPRPVKFKQATEEWVESKRQLRT